MFKVQTIAFPIQIKLRVFGKRKFDILRSTQSVAGIMELIICYPIVKIKRLGTM